MTFHATPNNTYADITEYGAGNQEHGTCVQFDDIARRFVCPEQEQRQICDKWEHWPCSFQRCSHFTRFVFVWIVHIYNDHWQAGQSAGVQQKFKAKTQRDAPWQSLPLPEFKSAKPRGQEQ